MDTNSLKAGLRFLKTFIDGRMKISLGQSDVAQFNEVACYQDGSPLSQFVEQYKPSVEEYIVLLLAIVPHIHPCFFSNLLSEYFPDGGEFPEFGGVKAVGRNTILATGETAQFILAGDDLGKRIQIRQLFNSDHWFSQKNILWLTPTRTEDSSMSGTIVADPEVVDWLLTGSVSAPRFSLDFPAERIETAMDWDDMVLNESTLHQIREIENWITHNGTLLNTWGMKYKIKPGFRALFYGPPGTGKTMTAMLLGKTTKKDVYRIDLSRIVSKYIGETEKNLSRLFDKAEHKNWILLFDEADALFGKRTGIQDAHDKYANQEVAYLLQRVEAYNGLVILATNQRSNIDEAFGRRFQAVIHFPVPRPEERYEIWRKSFPPQIAFSQGIDWHQVAARYELTGSSILNIAQYCSISALQDQSHHVDLSRIETAIRREYVKDGMIV